MLAPQAARRPGLLRWRHRPAGRRGRLTLTTSAPVNIAKQTASKGRARQGLHFLDDLFGDPADGLGHRSAVHFLAKCAVI